MSPWRKKANCTIKLARYWIWTIKLPQTTFVQFLPTEDVVFHSYYLVIYTYNIPEKLLKIRSASFVFSIHKCTLNMEQIIQGVKHRISKFWLQRILLFTQIHCDFIPITNAISMKNEWCFLKTVSNQTNTFWAIDVQGI